MLLTTLREHARLHRGILIVAPVFWGAVTAFLSPGYGLAGFIVHFILCLPKRKSGWIAMAMAYPAFMLWFAARDPSLTLARIPWHRTRVAQEGFRFRVGEVENFPVETGEGYGVLLKNEEGIYRVSLPGKIPPALGSIILVSAREQPAEPPPNPGERDPRKILRAQGAAAFLQGENWSELKPPSAWNRGLSWLRVQLEKSLTRHVPAPALPLVAATLLNDTHGLSVPTQQDFLRSGMQHIIAISGQHIALLVAFLLLPALCLRLPRKAAFLAAAACVMVYIPVTGSPVSVARAGLMLACFLPAVFLERPTSGLHSFCLAMALDLLISPFHVLNLGFQLSYAATLALILCAGPGLYVKKSFKNRILGSAAQMIFLSGLVTIFTYPILAASVHAMSPWSVLGNLATVPLSSAMLIGGLCVWALSPLPLLAHWAGACTGMCSLLLEGCVHFLARLPGTLWPIAEPSSFWIAFLMIFSLLLATLFRLNRWRLGFLCAAVVVGAEIFRPCLSAPFPGSARVTLLSVGHGDAAVLEIPGGDILIDDGPSPDDAMKVILPFLQSRGIRRLDAVVLTHPDLDHYGGTFGLLDRVPIGFIVAPPISSSDAGWNCLKDAARRRGIPWKEGRMGDLLYQKGTVSLRILGPDSAMDSSASDNNHSLVCLLQTARHKALFTGDIEGPAQLALASTWPLWRGAWLKAPHHGSDRTTLPCFLTAAAPPQAAISSGRRPGFPGPATMAFLEGLHANTGVTARDGALIWRL